MRWFSMFLLSCAAPAALACGDPRGPGEESGPNPVFAAAPGGSGGTWHARGSLADHRLRVLAQFNAVSDTGGARARGRWYYRQEFGGRTVSELARVTCLAVRGRDAAIGVHFTESTNPTRPVGSYAVIWVSDHGNASPRGPADTWDASAVLHAPPDCVPRAAQVPWPGDLLVQE